ncbi:hypothetical protein [Corynebacterium glutamicum]|uniref:RelA/SpoT domain-containing protein n=1 Tax=Corynebacterium glutamicum (strain R) TaxID=340322 RepID=A0AB72VF94_CORGB|nr:hypothetical protein [Corynebacterium glutamicum]BAQ21177.1 hypothetical protein cgR_6115 [Corynebacterium glutamicum R]
MAFNEKPGWSKGQMNRIGDALEGKRELDKDLYQQMIHWHEDLLAELYLVAVPILEKRVVVHADLLRVGQISNDIVYSSRIKNEDTIVEKLSRLKTDLARVQDFAGARFDIDCSPATQNAVAGDLKLALEELDCSVVKKPYLETSQYGYRAVHLHITSVAGRLELQIRNKFQAEWANTFELLADLEGREIRYGQASRKSSVNKLIESLQRVSDAVYRFDAKEDEVDLQIQRVEKLVKDYRYSRPEDLNDFSLIEKNFTDSKKNSHRTRQDLIDSMSTIKRQLRGVGKVMS